MQLFTRPIPIAATLLLSLPYGLQALALTPKISIQSQKSVDRKAEADTLYKHGFEQYKSRQFQQALATFQKVFTIERKTGNQPHIAKTLSAIGDTYFRLSQYPNARDSLNQALVIYRQIGDQKSIGDTLQNIGATYEHLKQFDKAKEFYRQAIAIYKERNDRTRISTLICQTKVSSILSKDDPFAPKCLKNNDPVDDSSDPPTVSDPHP